MRCGDFYLKNRQFDTDITYLWNTFLFLGCYLLAFLGLTAYFLTRKELQEAAWGLDRRETAL